MADEELNDLQERLKRLKKPSKPTIEERFKRLNPKSSYVLNQTNPNYMFLGPKKTEEEEVDNLLRQFQDGINIEQNDTNDLLSRFKKLNPSASSVASTDDGGGEVADSNLEGRLKKLDPGAYAVSSRAKQNFDFDNYVQPSEEEQINQILSQINDSVMLEDQLGIKDENKNEQETQDEEELDYLKEKQKEEKRKKQEKQEKREKLKKYRDKQKSQIEKKKNFMSYLKGFGGKSSSKSKKKEKKKKKKKGKSGYDYDDDDSLTEETESEDDGDDDGWEFL